MSSRAVTWISHFYEAISKPLTLSRKWYKTSRFDTLVDLSDVMDRQKPTFDRDEMTGVADVRAASYGIGEDFSR
ncbi:hypothetical protein RRG08_065425 [Elysia crispata]|uniref:Uncharacterized protein n=1 Tax=Elysia crispata TaxID=231223 RepID=A0AAE0ZX39_9GAST|nr:hypothetical protein RRG08_065425 [Elysia crispata]